MEDFVINTKCNKLLRKQRNLTIEKKETLIRNLNKYINKIKLYLPENPKKIVDIGCGLAILDVFLYNFYKKDDITFYLFDRHKIDKEIHYAYTENPSFYNNLEYSKEICIDNGIKEQNIQIVKASKENLSELSNIDLVISTLAWGFHFPVSIYVKEVYDMISPNGICILDVRKDEDLIELQKYFFDVFRIDTYTTVCFK